MSSSTKDAVCLVATTPEDFISAASRHLKILGQQQHAAERRSFMSNRGRLAVTQRDSLVRLPPLGYHPSGQGAGNPRASLSQWRHHCDNQRRGGAVRDD
jgi:hypothetical protein